MAAEEQGGPSADVLRQSLNSRRAEMRGMAARIVGLTLRHTLYDDVAAALERENHGAAAAEQVRAMLYLQGTAAISAYAAQWTGCRRSPSWRWPSGSPGLTPSSSSRPPTCFARRDNQNAAHWPHSV